MSKKKRTPLATDANGNLFVELAAIMHPMVAINDGLTLAFFGKEHKAYLAVDDAIAWCKKEMERFGDKSYQIKIDVLERFKAQEQKAQ